MVGACYGGKREVCGWGDFRERILVENQKITKLCEIDIRFIFLVLQYNIENSLKTTKESGTIVENNFISEPWLGTKEIAEHLGVTVVTVRKWIAAKKIPCHRMGKLWKFKASEVDAWIISGGAEE